MFRKTSITVSCMLATAAAYAAPPRVERFLLDQNIASHEVEVSFDIAAEAVLTMDVKTNGVSIGWRNFRPGVTGAALNAVNPAGSYVLRWKPWETWTPQEDKFPSGAVEIEVKAWSIGNTPDYMVVDLTSSSNVCYYVDEADLPLPVTNSLYKTDAMVFKRVHGAGKTWRMGSPTSEAGRPGTAKANRERPHLVTFGADWYMAVFETTQGQWKRMRNASTIGACAVTNDACPAVNMTCRTIRGCYADCYWPRHGHAVYPDSVADKFRKLTGIKVDLPTEAQWEFACRGGTATAYADGANSVTSESLSKFTVWSGNAPEVNGKKAFAEVGTLAANGYGLYDMVGNVSEMCLDYPVVNYPEELQIDPVGDDNGFTLDWRGYSLTVRGSNYNHDMSKWDDGYSSTMQYHRSAYRGYAYGDVRQTDEDYIGFRFAAPVGDWAPLTFASAGAEQDAGSRVVNIVYDLDADSIVTLSATTNGVALSDTAFRSVAGDVNRLVPAGSGKRICWQPDASWPGQNINSGVEFKIQKWNLADPPPYMALDLTHSCMTNIFWYTSADAMPEPITNDIWKTDYLVMRRVPAKDVVWMMGIATNSAGESVEGVGYDPTQSPRHRVKLSQDYYIGVFEVTKRQATLAWGASAASEDDYTLPYTSSFTTLRSRSATVWPQNGHAVSSSSPLAQLRKRFGLQFDLPTEAQWEYACRACTGSAFCNPVGGNSSAALSEYGRFKDNADALCPVGTRKPNAFGLYDMHGNAHEYCLDARSNSYGLSAEALASDEPTVDPYGPSSGITSASNRLMRGGSYGSDFYKCRSGDRGQDNHPDSAWTSTGCRVVCPLPGATFPDPVIGE